MSGQVLYGVNDDTAIDVFVSDESQVTMCVVGIGFDTDISEAEDEKSDCVFGENALIIRNIIKLLQ